MEAYAQKRQDERYRVCISCELTISGETLHAETQNLSTGGAAVRFTRDLKVGEVVTVSLFLTEDGIEAAGGTPFECAASVRWTKPAGEGWFTAGLQFLAPSEEQRQLLRDFLARSRRLQRRQPLDPNTDAVDRHQPAPRGEPLRVRVRATKKRLASSLGRLSTPEAGDML